MPHPYAERRLIDAFRPDEACTIDTMELCDDRYGVSSAASRACHQGARDRYLLEAPRFGGRAGSSGAYLDGYTVADQACAPRLWAPPLAPWGGWGQGAYAPWGRWHPPPPWQPLAWRPPPW